MATKSASGKTELVESEGKGPPESTSYTQTLMTACNQAAEISKNVAHKVYTTTKDTVSDVIEAVQNYSALEENPLKKTGSTSVDPDVKLFPSQFYFIDPFSNDIPLPVPNLCPGHTCVPSYTPQHLAYNPPPPQPVYWPPAIPPVYSPLPLQLYQDAALFNPYIYDYINSLNKQWYAPEITEKGTKKRKKRKHSKTSKKKRKNRRRKKEDVLGDDEPYSWSHPAVRKSKWWSVWNRLDESQGHPLKTIRPYFNHKPYQDTGTVYQAAGSYDVLPDYEQAKPTVAHMRQLNKRKKSQLDPPPRYRYSSFDKKLSALEEDQYSETPYPRRQSADLVYAEDTVVSDVDDWRVRRKSAATSVSEETVKLQTPPVTRVHSPEENVTHLSATLFRSLQVKLRSRKGNSYKVKRFNMDTQSAQLLGSFFSCEERAEKKVRPKDDCEDSRGGGSSRHHRQTSTSLCGCSCLDYLDATESIPTYPGRHLKRIMSHFYSDLMNLPERNDSTLKKESCAVNSNKSNTVLSAQSSPACTCDFKVQCKVDRKSESDSGKENVKTPTKVAQNETCDDLRFLCPDTNTCRMGVLELNTKPHIKHMSSYRKYYFEELSERSEETCSENEISVSSRSNDESHDESDNRLRKRLATRMISPKSSQYSSKNHCPPAVSFSQTFCVSSTRDCQVKISQNISAMRRSPRGRIEHLPLSYSVQGLSNSQKCKKLVCNFDDNATDCDSAADEKPYKCLYVRARSRPRKSTDYFRKCSRKYCLCHPQSSLAVCDLRHGNEGRYCKRIGSPGGHQSDSSNENLCFFKKEKSSGFGAANPRIDRMRNDPFYGMDSMDDYRGMKKCSHEIKECCCVPKCPLKTDECCCMPKCSLKTDECCCMPKCSLKTDECCCMPKCSLKTDECCCMPKSSLKTDECCCMPKCSLKTDECCCMPKCSLKTDECCCMPKRSLEMNEFCYEPNSLVQTNRCCCVPKCSLKMNDCCYKTPCSLIKNCRNTPSCSQIPNDCRQTPLGLQQQIDCCQMKLCSQQPNDCRKTPLRSQEPIDCRQTPLCSRQPNDCRQMLSCSQQPNDCHQTPLCSQLPNLCRQTPLCSQQPNDCRKTPLRSQEPIDCRQTPLCSRQPNDCRQMLSCSQQPNDCHQTPLCSQLPNLCRQTPLCSQQPNDYRQTPLCSQQPNDYRQTALCSQQPNDYRQTPLCSQQPKNYRQMPISSQPHSDFDQKPTCSPKFNHCPDFPETPEQFRECRPIQNYTKEANSRSVCYEDTKEYISTPNFCGPEIRTEDDNGCNPLQHNSRQTNECNPFSGNLEDTNDRQFLPNHRKQSKNCSPSGRQTQNTKNNPNVCSTFKQTKTDAKANETCKTNSTFGEDKRNKVCHGERFSDMHEVCDDESNEKTRYPPSKKVTYADKETTCRLKVKTDKAKKGNKHKQVVNGYLDSESGDADNICTKNQCDYMKDSSRKCTANELDPCDARDLDKKSTRSNEEKCPIQNKRYDNLEKRTKFDSKNSRKELPCDETNMSELKPPSCGNECTCDFDNSIRCDQDDDKESSSVERKMFRTCLDEMAKSKEKSRRMKKEHSDCIEKVDSHKRKSKKQATSEHSKSSRRSKVAKKSTSTENNKVIELSPSTENKKTAESSTSSSNDQSTNPSSNSQSNESLTASSSSSSDKLVDASPSSSQVDQSTTQSSSENLNEQGKDVQEKDKIDHDQSMNGASSKDRIQTKPEESFSQFSCRTNNSSETAGANHLELDPIVPTRETDDTFGRKYCFVKHCSPKKNVGANDINNKCNKYKFMFKKCHHGKSKWPECRNFEFHEDDRLPCITETKVSPLTYQIEQTSSMLAFNGPCLERHQDRCYTTSRSSMVEVKTNMPCCNYPSRSNSDCRKETRQPAKSLATERNKNLHSCNVNRNTFPARTNYDSKNIESDCTEAFSSTSLVYSSNYQRLLHYWERICQKCRGNTLEIKDNSDSNESKVKTLPKFYSCQEKKKFTKTQIKPKASKKFSTVSSTNEWKRLCESKKRTSASDISYSCSINQQTSESQCVTSDECFDPNDEVMSQFNHKCKSTSRSKVNSRELISKEKMFCSKIRLNPDSDEESTIRSRTDCTQKSHLTISRACEKLNDLSHGDSGKQNRHTGAKMKQACPDYSRKDCKPFISRNIIKDKKRRKASQRCAENLGIYPNSHVQNKKPIDRGYVDSESWEDNNIKELYSSCSRENKMWKKSSHSCSDSRQTKRNLSFKDKKQTNKGYLDSESGEDSKKLHSSCSREDKKQRNSSCSCSDNWQIPCSHSKQKNLGSNSTEYQSRQSSESYEDVKHGRRHHKQRQSNHSHTENKVAKRNNSRTYCKPIHSNHSGVWNREAFTQQSLDDSRKSSSNHSREDNKQKHSAQEFADSKSAKRHNIDKDSKHNDSNPSLVDSRNNCPARSHDRTGSTSRSRSLKDRKHKQTSSICSAACPCLGCTNVKSGKIMSPCKFCATASLGQKTLSNLEKQTSPNPGKKTLSNLGKQTSPNPGKKISSNSRKQTSSKPEKQTSSKPEKQTSSKPEKQTSSKPEKQTSSNLGKQTSSNGATVHIESLTLPCFKSSSGNAEMKTSLSDNNCVEMTSSRESTFCQGFYTSPCCSCMNAKTVKKMSPCFTCVKRKHDVSPGPSRYQTAEDTNECPRRECAYVKLEDKSIIDQRDQSVHKLHPSRKHKTIISFPNSPTVLNQDRYCTLSRLDYSHRAQSKKNASKRKTFQVEQEDGLNPALPCVCCVSPPVEGKSTSSISDRSSTRPTNKSKTSTSGSASNKPSSKQASQSESAHIGDQASLTIQLSLSASSKDSNMSFVGSTNFKLTNPSVFQCSSNEKQKPRIPFNCSVPSIGPVWENVQQTVNGDKPNTHPGCCSSKPQVEDSFHVHVSTENRTNSVIENGGLVYMENTIETFITDPSDKPMDDNFKSQKGTSVEETFKENMHSQRWFDIIKVQRNAVYDFDCPLSSESNVTYVTSISSLPVSVVNDEQRTKASKVSCHSLNRETYPCDEITSITACDEIAPAKNKELSPSGHGANNIPGTKSLSKNSSEELEVISLEDDWNQYYSVSGKSEECQSQNCSIPPSSPLEETFNRLDKNSDQLDGCKPSRCLPYQQGPSIVQSPQSFGYGRGRPLQRDTGFRSDTWKISSQFKSSLGRAACFAADVSKCTNYTTNLGKKNTYKCGSQAVTNKHTFRTMLHKSTRQYSQVNNTLFEGCPIRKSMIDSQTKRSMYCSDFRAGCKPPKSSPHRRQTTLINEPKAYTSSVMNSIFNIQDQDPGLSDDKHRFLRSHLKPFGHSSLSSSPRVNVISAEIKAKILSPPRYQQVRWRPTVHCTQPSPVSDEAIVKYLESCTAEEFWRYLYKVNHNFSSDDLNKKNCKSSQTYFNTAKTSAYSPKNGREILSHDMEQPISYPQHDKPLSTHILPHNNKKIPTLEYFNNIQPNNRLEQTQKPGNTWQSYKLKCEACDNDQHGSLMKEEKYKEITPVCRCRKHLDAQRHEIKRRDDTWCCCRNQSHSPKYPTHISIHINIDSPRQDNSSKPTSTTQTTSEPSKNKTSKKRYEGKMATSDSETSSADSSPETTEKMILKYALANKLLKNHREGKLKNYKSKKQKHRENNLRKLSEKKFKLSLETDKCSTSTEDRHLTTKFVRTSKKDPSEEVGNQIKNRKDIKEKELCENAIDEGSESDIKAVERRGKFLSSTSAWTDTADSLQDSLAASVKGNNDMQDLNGKEKIIHIDRLLELDLQKLLRDAHEQCRQPWPQATDKPNLTTTSSRYPPEMSKKPSTSKARAYPQRPMKTIKELNLSQGVSVKHSQTATIDPYANSSSYSSFCEIQCSQTSITSSKNNMKKKNFTYVSTILQDARLNRPVPIVGLNTHELRSSTSLDITDSGNRIKPILQRKINQNWIGQESHVKEKHQEGVDEDSVPNTSSMLAVTQNTNQQGASARDNSQHRPKLAFVLTSPPASTPAITPLSPLVQTPMSLNRSTSSETQ